jgi:hypothetical protein
MALNYKQINPVGTFTQTRTGPTGPLDLHQGGMAGFSALDEEEKEFFPLPAAFFYSLEKPNPGSKDLAGKAINRRRSASFQYNRTYLKTGGDQGCRTVEYNGDNGGKKQYCTCRLT